MSVREPSLPFAFKGSDFSFFPGCPACDIARFWGLQQQCPDGIVPVPRRHWPWLNTIFNVACFGQAVSAFCLPLAILHGYVRIRSQYPSLVEHLCRLLPVAYPNV